MIKKFSFEELTLKGAYLISPFIADDNRGLFVKDYSKEDFTANKINHDLKEVFYTESYKGVIRALHFQEEKQQAKLVRCITGEIYDVIVDLRIDSITFGEHLSFYLSGDNKKSLYIPEGFAHGYLVIDNSIVSYKCSEKFYGEYDSGIMWNDEDLNIKWPLDKVDNSVIISEKDKNLRKFGQYVLDEKLKKGR